MGFDLASLRIEIDSKQVADATTALNGLAAAAKNAEEATKKHGAGQRKTATEINQALVQQSRDYQEYTSKVKTASTAQREHERRTLQFITADKKLSLMEQGREYQTYISKISAQNAQRVLMERRDMQERDARWAREKQIMQQEIAMGEAIIAIRKRQLVQQGLTRVPDASLFSGVPIAPPTQDAYTLAGVKSPTQRAAEIKNVTTAMAQLRAEHDAGNVTGKVYTQTMHSLTGRLSLLEHGSSRARGAFRQMASAMASLTFEMTGAIYGFLALAAAIAAPIIPGIKLAKTMEDTSLGMAAILISMGKIDGASIELPQALQISGEMMDKLVNDSMRFGVSIEALANTLRSTLAPGLAAGMNLEEIQKVATIGTIAVRTIGLDAKQTVQEVRDLVAGGIQAASSTLATSLGIKDADIKRWRDAKTIYEELMNKMLGFQIAAGENAKTLSGAWGILQTKIALLMNSEEGFNALKGIVIDISNYVGKFNEATNRMEFNPELVKQAKAYWDILLGIKDVLVAVGNVALVVSPALVPALQTIAVLLSEVTFTISTVAKEIAVIATQVVAVAHLDFKAASGIGSEWKAEAAAARAAQDERVKKILGLSVAVPPAAPADSGAGKVKGTPSPSESWAKLYQDQVQKKADAIKKLDEQYAIETRRFADNQEHQIGLAKDYQVKLDVINKQFDKKEKLVPDYEYKAEKSEVDRLVKQQGNEIAILESSHQHKLISEEQYQSQLEGIYENYDAKILKDYGHSMMRLQDKIDSTHGAEQQAATDHYNKMLTDVEGYLAKRGLRILNSANREKQILQESAEATASFIAKATEDVKAIEERSGATRRKQDMTPIELAGYEAKTGVSKLFDTEIAVRSAKASRLISDGMAETSTEVIAQRDAIKDLIAARDSLAERAQKGAIAEAEYARSFESGMRDALQKYADEATNVAKHTEDVMTSAFKGMEDALVKFVETGKLNFKDLASSIIKDMMRIQIKENITGPLAKWMNTSLKGLNFGGGENLSAAAGLDSISYTAHGNVFASPGLSAYSNTVVDRPTLFPFAHGIGMMGEAGAEAIMPLKRLSGGDLGVKAEVAPVNGRGVTIVNNFTLNQPADRRTQEQIAAMAGASIQTAMARGA